VNAINVALDKLGKPTQLLPKELFVPDRAALGRIAGQGIAYVHDADSATDQARYAEIRAIFARLGEEVARRMQL
jgi:hypothetical protein